MADQRPIPGTGPIVERRRTLTRDRRQQLRVFAEAQTAAGGTVRAIDVMRALGASRSAVDKLLAEFAAAGELLPLARRDGWVAASAAGPARTLTLASIVALARQQARPDAVARRGRQADSASRDVETITMGQLGDIERLVALVLRHTPTAGGDPARVSDADFVWVPELDSGRGGWALQGPVQRWVEAEHRARHEKLRARGVGRRAPWVKADAAAAVRDYRGAVNNLLFLAATHGLIDRSPRNTGGEITRYAPSWTPVLERWNRILAPGAGSPRRLSAGLRTLAIVATHLGGRTRSTTDWLAVRASLESDHAAGRISDETLRHARYAWRTAAVWIAARCALPEAFVWPVPAELRTTLVTQAAIDAAGVANVGMAARDFTGWKTLEGRYPTALIENPCGLRAFAAWSTLPEAQLRRQVPPLPARTWALPPSIGRRRKKHEQPAQVKTSTLRTRLRMLAHLAGYAAAVRGTDWATADLLTLCDPGLVDDYLAWADALPPDPRGDRRAQLLHTTLTIAFVVNGFLCARASQAIAGAVAAGNTAATTAARAQLDQLQGWYRRIEVLAGEREQPAHKDLHQVAAHIIEVAAGWRGTDQVEGLLKLPRLVDALCEEACTLAGGRSLEAQRTAIADGTFQPSAEWATRVRLATLLVLLQRIPVRGHTVEQLTLAMWEALPVGPEAAARVLAPWEGALRLVLPVKFTKGGRTFSPPLILPSRVRTSTQAGSDAHETAIRRPLLTLWLCAGGGRDVCRTSYDALTGRAIRHDVPWLFPDLATSEAAGDERGRWLRGSISAAFRAAVIRHADRLAVDVARLRKLRGALGIHVVRRLFGTYWAPRNLVYCSRLLDHADIAITAAVYTAKDERTMSLDAEATAVGEAQVQSAGEEAARAERLELVRLIDRMHGELATLREQNAALLARLTPDPAA